MICNPYQEQLAERSLEVGPAEEGQYWTFYWYVNPISNGLSKGHRFFAHVYPEGRVDMIGMWIALNDEEKIAQQQAIQFAKQRYERYGLNEEDLEGED